MHSPPSRLTARQVQTLPRHIHELITPWQPGKSDILVLYFSLYILFDTSHQPPSKCRSHHIFCLEDQEVICQARTGNKQGQIHYIPAISSLKVVSPFWLVVTLDLVRRAGFLDLIPGCQQGSSLASVDLRECNARTIEAQNRGR